MVRYGQSDYSILQQKMINPNSGHVNSSLVLTHGKWKGKKLKFSIFGHNKVCLTHIHSLTFEDLTTTGKNEDNI